MKRLGFLLVVSIAFLVMGLSSTTSAQQKADRYISVYPNSRISNNITPINTHNNGTIIPLTALIANKNMIETGKVPPSVSKTEKYLFWYKRWHDPRYVSPFPSGGKVPNQ